ncbi:erythromycin esterase family protein [Streptomyces sp. NPDC086787]|uniref:erythromycin esterase family protein n=1 Tax=Streptomyces sp. NPDC086787 TaxID=3365759 RepID=UPI00382C3AB1
MTAAIEAAARAVDATTLTRLLPARPLLLALGEPAHGEDVLLELRNDVFRQLVEQGQYRTIALESDCMSGVLVDEYVTSGRGTLDEVMEHGFSHGFGEFAGNRELVRWMRAYNEGRPAAEWLHFAGYDGPVEYNGAASPREALTALHSYLRQGLEAALVPCDADTLDRLLGDDERWTSPAAMMDPGRSVGQTPEAGQLRLLADELVALLDARSSQLVEASSLDDWDRARMYGHTATGLLQYHFWMADSSPSRMPRLLGLRESMMADNLLALAERGPVLAHGHNGHLQRDKSSMRMGDQLLEWSSAGTLVSARLGERYALTSTLLGSIPRRGVDAPPPDTIEGVLYGLAQDRYVIDAGQLADMVADVPLVHRESPWYGYSPQDPTHLASSDAILFVREVPAS